jgi:hypothetical protein
LLRVVKSESATMSEIFCISSSDKASTVRRGPFSGRSPSCQNSHRRRPTLARFRMAYNSCDKFMVPYKNGDDRIHHQGGHILSHVK